MSEPLMVVSLSVPAAVADAASACGLSVEAFCVRAIEDAVALEVFEVSRSPAVAGSRLDVPSYASLFRDERRSSERSRS